MHGYVNASRIVILLSLCVMLTGKICNAQTQETAQSLAEEQHAKYQHEVDCMNRFRLPHRDEDILISWYGQARDWTPSQIAGDFKAQTISFEKEHPRLALQLLEDQVQLYKKAYKAYCPAYDAYGADLISNDRWPDDNPPLHVYGKRFPKGAEGMISDLKRRLQRHS